ncbi:MAG: aminotransferase class V-fold PLP-dependent enzyme [Gammaproteobacteria bacterium]|nr:aminotransferase class V-fold PLP-dependent enzyme [Gammaproteobacteria bacterium]
MNRSFTSEFALDAGLIHLNHAAVAPWPRRTVEAVSRFALENMRRGSWNYPDWLRTEALLRGQLAELIHAPSADDIALVKNTSEALSFVAAGIAWQAGENIVSSNQEFPSNRIVWESLAAKGVELRQAELDGAATPEDALFALVDTKTRLLAISSVQYASGLRMDLERIGRFCRDREILFCVDAIQSVGAVRFDVAAIHADFVAADGHKWLLGPEGLGFFYCRPELRNVLKLTQYGWHMVEAIGDFEQRAWQPASSARRFECGSPNMLSIHALSASLSLLLEVGMATVEERLLANSGWLMEALGQLPGVVLVTPRTEECFAGIVTFRLVGQEAKNIFDALHARGIFCAHRAGGIRFAPHFYTDRAQLETALNTLKSLLNSDYQ